jgi:hypothetical protein
MDMHLLTYVEQNGIKWGKLEGCSNTHMYICRYIDSMLKGINSIYFGRYTLDMALKRLIRRFEGGLKGRGYRS